MRSEVDSRTRVLRPEVSNAYSRAVLTVDSPDCVSRLMIRVGFTDVDLMGVVHHARYFGYFEMARIEYMRRRDIDYSVCARDGVHLAVVEANAHYRSPARFDERLVVECALCAMTGATVTCRYRIVRGSDERLLVDGRTLLACVGNSNRPKRFPADLRGRLLRAETAPRELDQI